MADTETLGHTTENMTLHSPLEEMHHQHEDDMKNIESGEEYSSGSDRSFEGDGVDDPRSCNSSSGKIISDVPIVAAKIRSKKRRHGSHGSRRQKGGSRHKHRSFQPYPDSSDLETSLKRKSMELQEKENAAALLRQEGGEDQFVTFPVAPFNSTQFLMDEHSLNSPKGVSKDYGGSPKVFTQDIALSSLSSTPKTDATDNLETLINLNRKDKEFSDSYSSIHAENLQNMSKEELVKHYMSLEEQVAQLQKKVAEAEQRSENSENESNKKLDQDCVPSSDTNSLSSGNEEFIDIASINNVSTDQTTTKD